MHNKIAKLPKIQFVKIGKKSVCRLTGLQRSGWCLPKTGRSLGQVVWMYTSSLSLSSLFLHLFLNESLHSWYVLFFFFFFVKHICTYVYIILCMCIYVHFFCIVFAIHRKFSSVCYIYIRGNSCNRYQLQLG